MVASAPSDPLREGDPSPSRRPKSFRSRRLRGLAAVAVLLLGLTLAGCGSGGEAPEGGAPETREDVRGAGGPGTAEPRVGDPASSGDGGPEAEVPPATRGLLERWATATRGSARERTRAERLADVEAVLEDVSPDRVRAVCAGADAFPASDRRALRRLARAVAGDDPRAVEAWTALLRDPEVGDDCREGVVMALQRAREVLGDDAAARISDALLDVADARPGEAGARWERLAAQFGTTDRVLRRVEALLSSADDESRARAARLGAESRDPRVGELLAGYLYRLAEAPAAHPVSRPLLVQAAAERGQGSALPGLEKVIFATGSPDLDSVAALGAIRSERTLAVIENVYEARAGIPEGERAELDAALHRAVRGVEPVILTILRDGDEAPAARAMRLLGLARESGPFARVDALRTALLDLAATRPEEERAEIVALAERVGARD